MDLAAYFDRIGYSGPRTPELATIEQLMRAHTAAIPFENLDVQLGTPIRIEPAAIFDKLVTRRRGGWCYEQNGLFGNVLGALGFDVRRISGGVMRVERGDAALGNHLTLLVMLDRPWLVDVGYGGAQAMPVPLAAGEHLHPPIALGLALQRDGHWRFTERYRDGAPFSFDFRDGPADEALLARQCAALQSDPESIFVQNLVVQQRKTDRHLMLRGRVLTERRTDGETQRLIGSADELVGVLREAFGLDVPEAAALWERICARHAVVFAAGVA
jgi:N-hydroxyarylamine O-acetyltransferase